MWNGRRDLWLPRLEPKASGATVVPTYVALPIGRTLATWAGAASSSFRTPVSSGNFRGERYRSEYGDMGLETCLPAGGRLVVGRRGTGMHGLGHGHARPRARLTGP